MPLNLIGFVSKFVFFTGQAFGFLGYSTFLVGFLWETIIWRNKREELSAGFSTATVIRGMYSI